MHIGGIHLCCTFFYSELCLNYVFSICIDHRVFVWTRAYVIADIVMDIPACLGVSKGVPWFVVLLFGIILVIRVIQGCMLLILSIRQYVDLVSLYL